MAYGAEEMLGVAVAQCGAWVGDERRRLRVEEAAFALRRIDDFDWALVRWCCGVDDAETRRAAWARVMLLGEPAKRADEAGGRPWPRGRLSACCATVLEELRPQVRKSGLPDWRRLALIAGHERAAPLARGGAWARRWKPRYLAILSEARRLEERVLASLEVRA